MTKKKTKFDPEKLKKSLPYFLSGILILGLVFAGSIDKYKSDIGLSLTTFTSDDAYSVSSDQLSELYVIADLSDASNLASADVVASNYVSTKTLYDSGQTSAIKIEKPNIIYISSRGVISYIVQDGDTMQSIAWKYGLSTDQIRWSNNLRTTDISAGDTLFLPSVSGIVYTVKTGDTIDSIVEKYGSSSAEIVALNDLEVSGVSEGMRIVIKNGTLPTTERPEYVAPVRYSYSYLGSTSDRKELSIVQYGLWLSTPYASGQCTSYAWYMRQDLPSNLGNANVWAANAADQGFPVDNYPQAGDIFQTPSGWYGHVGYVVALNDDGSILVREMNYGYRAGCLSEAIIPAESVKNFNYIHKK